MKYFLTLISLLVLVSCSKDDDNSEPPLNGTGLTLGGTTYDIQSGAIEDYGTDDYLEEGFNHTNYDFFLVDFEDIFDTPDSYAFLYAELFSGGNEFTPGTYTFASESTDPSSLEGDNFFVTGTFEMYEGESFIGGYLVVDGDITVVENGALDYTLTFDVTVMEYDLVSEVLISGSETDINFSFRDEDGFDYFDMTTSGARFSDTIIDQIRKQKKHQ